MCRNALCIADTYVHHLRALGCEAEAIILNADPLQRRWAREHGLELSGDPVEQRKRVVAAQIERVRPDVLFVFEWCPLGDAFLSDVKRSTRLLVGQVASPLSPDRTYASYDLMVSSFPPLVDHFRRMGMGSESLKLGFDTRVLDALPDSAEERVRSSPAGTEQDATGGLTIRPGTASVSAAGRVEPRSYDVTFVGGFAPSHPDRIPWLEKLLGAVEIDIFGYGLERTRPESAIRSHHRGSAWGRRMYDVLRRSRITLNQHARIDVDGTTTAGFANNMRLYEATGVGACLITDEKANLPDLFEPGREVVTYQGDADCVEKIRYFLTHERERQTIARAGQARTLRDHGYAARLSELLEMLRRRL